MASLLGTTMSGIMSMMLAKFMLNDVPHAAGMIPHTRYDDPSTGPQLSYIALLCQRTHTTIIHEERVKTFGEAGRVISELKAEEARQKREQKSIPFPTRRKKFPPPKIGAPSPARPKVPPDKIETGVELPVPVGKAKFIVRRSTVERELDVIERARARVASDMDTRMQSSYSIVGNIMGYYYDSDVVVAERNGELVGIAAYVTAHIYDYNTDETNIQELASLTYEPGVGKAIVEEIIKIAKEQGASSITVNYGPGARGFYERLGFIEDARYVEGRPEAMVLKLNPSSPTVTLYHGTSREVAAIALKEGLTPQPGIETEFPSLYLTYNFQEASKYGEVVLKIVLPEEELVYMQETVEENVRTTYPIEAKYIVSIE